MAIDVGVEGTYLSLQRKALTGSLVSNNRPKASYSVPLHRYLTPPNSAREDLGVQSFNTKVCARKTRVSLWGIERRPTLKGGKSSKRQL